MGQWMAGFCRSMRDEACQNNKEAMLEYLISLLDNSNDSHGLQPKPAVPYSSVVWNRERSRTLLK